MAEQRLFERVDLRGEGEGAKIQQLLEQALAARLQEPGSEQLTEEDREALLAASADFVAQLRQFVVFAEPDEQDTAAAQRAGAGPTSMLHTQLTPGIASLALRSPLLAPLSPPPVDAEVQALEAEVTEASLRVAELRTSMQAKLQEQLAAKLAACRPAADLEPQQQQAVADGEGTAAAQPGGQPAAHEVAQQGADGVAPPAEEQQVQPMDAEPAAVQMSPRPDELQQRLLQAANRMPALRARLEQATDRLQRVVAAVAADIARPPPNTVEKAMLGKTPGRPATAAAGAGADAAGAEENVPGVSPLFKQALESGQISTRRRVGRDVQPVPYSQPE